jgi:hypothetical protein|tara:strand:+ start:176 stop:379 length:204 start_codon:yes stop_codon:yes gene_type:complete
MKTFKFIQGSILVLALAVVSSGIIQIMYHLVQDVNTALEGLIMGFLYAFILVLFIVVWYGVILIIKK